MEITTLYGEHIPLTLELDEDDVLYAHRMDGENLATETIAERIAQALDAPLGFLPLRESLIGSDHLVIPVMPETPGETEILRGILTYLERLESSHMPKKVTFLRAENDTWMLDDLPQYAEVVTIQAENDEQFAMLDITHEGEPLKIARLLFDADFILPVGTFFPESTDGYFGEHSTLYPIFSNAETQKRFRQCPHGKKSAGMDKTLERMYQEPARITQLLGITLAIRVLPGVPSLDGRDVADILVGENHRIQREGAKRYRKIWTLRENCLADTVVATLQGGPAQQTWNNAFRAVVTAAHWTYDGGTIALCCDLSEPFPLVMEALRQVRNIDLLRRKLNPLEVENAATAIAFLRVLANCRVFFLCGLEGDRLEEIEIMPLEDGEDLERLIQNNGTCVFLPNAHHVIFDPHGLDGVSQEED